MKLHETQPGDRICIPGYKATEKGLVVVKVSPGAAKSSLLVTFQGGRNYDLMRYTEVQKVETA